MSAGLVKAMRSVAGVGLLLLLLGGGAPQAGAGHFPAPTLTLASAVYLVDFRIDGLAARAGDEIAFFDPQGILCGRKVVEASEEGQLVMVTVYGDDSQTAAIDEGAVAGDVLAVRFWQASPGREYADAALRLTPGAAAGSFSPATVPPLWQANGLYALAIDTATHFSHPTLTPYVANYLGAFTVGGTPAEIGDEVAIFDARGLICGLFRVNVPGGYGIATVYGDDPDTVANEGAREGETLTFRVWDRSAAVEYGAEALLLKSGAPIGSFGASVLPPVWTKDAGYVLDIAVAKVKPGDMDGNDRIDLADAIAVLKLLARLSPAPAEPSVLADVNGDLRIGLEEALFILQGLADLR